jgi:acyl-ACP thioesterase
MEYMSRKVRFVGEGISKEEIVVKQHHLDTNCHVNNGQYVEMAMDFLPKDFAITRLRVEYRKSALLSDVIIPIVYHEEQTVGISLQTQQQDIYANVEFSSATHK